MFLLSGQVVAPRNDDRASLYQLLDRSGYAAVATAPVVRVEVEREKNKWEPYAFGFLAEQEKDWRRVLKDDLRSLRIERNPRPNTLAYRTVELNPKQALQERRRQLTRGRPYAPGLFFTFSPTPDFLTALLLARSASARGYERIADEYLSIAKSRAGSLALEATTSQVAQITLGDIIADIVNPRLPWSVALNRLDQYIAAFPTASNLTEAKEAAETLRLMVSEESQHPRRDLGALSLEEKIKKLIFQLPWQTLNTSSFEGWGAIVPQPEGTDPASELGRIGLPAVPALIEAIDDTRFIKAQQRRREQFLSGIWRVRSAALSILESFAGRRLLTKADAQSWYAQVQAKGYRQVLVEGVSSGDRESRSALDILRVKFPEAVAEAVRAGLANAPTGTERKNLIYGLPNAEDPAVLKILREVSRTDRIAEVRIAAAQALARQDADEATPLLVKEYLALLIQNENSRQWLIEDTLLQLERPEALAAIVKRFDEKDSIARAVLLGRVNGFTYVQKPSEAQRNQFRRDLELFVASQLRDVSRAWGISGSGGSYAYASPRVADVASRLLAQLNPKKYPLPEFASPRQLEEARIRNLKSAFGERIPKPKWPTASGNVVADIELNGKLPVALAARWSALKGKPLPAKELTALAMETINSLKGLKGSVTITAQREADNSGVAIAVICSEAPERGTSTRMRYDVLSKELHRYNSHRGYGASKEFEQGLERDVDEALKLPINQVLEILIGASWTSGE